MKLCKNKEKQINRNAGIYEKVLVIFQQIPMSKSEVRRKTEFLRRQECGNKTIVLLFLVGFICREKVWMFDGFYRRGKSIGAAFSKDAEQNGDAQLY